MPGRRTRWCALPTRTARPRCASRLWRRPERSGQAWRNTWRAGRATPNTRLRRRPFRGWARRLRNRRSRPLLDALRSEAGARRKAAVTALAAHGSADAVSALEWTASADPEVEMARAAVEGLAAVASAGGSGVPPAVEALVSLLADARIRESRADRNRPPAGRDDPVAAAWPRARRSGGPSGDCRGARPSASPRGDGGHRSGARSSGRRDPRGRGSGARPDRRSGCRQAVAAGRQRSVQGGSAGCRRGAWPDPSSVRQPATDRSSNAGRRDDPMGFDAESLGLSDSALGLLRDLVHERTGVFYDDNRRDMLRRSTGAAGDGARLRVVSRLLLLAQVRRRRGGRMGPGDGRAERARKRTSGGRWISCRPSRRRSCPTCRAGHRPGPSGSGRCRARPARSR